MSKFTDEFLTAPAWEPSPEDTNALEAVRVVLGVQDLKWEDIPEDATFSLRRDVEYYAGELCAVCKAPEGSWDHELNEHDFEPVPMTHINADTTARPESYAAPRGEGWEISGDTTPIESEWVGRDVWVLAYRWDIYNVPKSELGKRLDELDLYADDLEPIMGYLEADGMHPCAQHVGDGMDWNVSGVTPVFLYVDYVVAE